MGTFEISARNRIYRENFQFCVENPDLHMLLTYPHTPSLLNDYGQMVKDGYFEKHSPMPTRTMLGTKYKMRLTFKGLFYMFMSQKYLGDIVLQHD